MPIGDVKPGIGLNKRPEKDEIKEKLSEAVDKITMAKTLAALGEDKKTSTAEVLEMMDKLGLSPAQQREFYQELLEEERRRRLEAEERAAREEERITARKSEETSTTATILQMMMAMMQTNMEALKMTFQQSQQATERQSQMMLEMMQQHINQLNQKIEELKQPSPPNPLEEMLKQKMINELAHDPVEKAFEKMMALEKYRAQFAPAQTISPVSDPLALREFDAKQKLLELELEAKKEDMRERREIERKKAESQIGLFNQLGQYLPIAAMTMAEMSQEQKQNAMGPAAPAQMMPGGQSYRCSHCGQEFILPGPSQKVYCPACGTPLIMPASKEEKKGAGA